MWASLLKAIAAIAGLLSSRDRMTALTSQLAASGAQIGQLRAELAAATARITVLEAQLRKYEPAAARLADVT